MARDDAGMLGKNGFAERTPVGRWGRPGEVAHAATFHAQPESGFITGATLAVDGGFTIPENPNKNIDASPLPEPDTWDEAQIGEVPGREHVVERSKASTFREDDELILIANEATVPPRSGAVLGSVRKAGKPMIGSGKRKTSSAASHSAALVAGQCFDALKVQARSRTVPGDRHSYRGHRSKKHRSRMGPTSPGLKWHFELPCIGGLKYERCAEDTPTSP